MLGVALNSAYYLMAVFMTNAACNSAVGLNQIRCCSAKNWLRFIF